MRKSILPYVVNENDTVLTALKRINDNKKGFLLVVSGEQLMGTLTDGDIRRAFIDGISTEDVIKDIFVKDYKFLSLSNSIGDAIDLFKRDSIKFIPIVNSDGALVNVLTKNQMHTLLIQDFHADLEYDFSSLDENLIDHEIFQRPWGFYKTTVMNDYCQSKIICVYPKGVLSLQSHEHREEYWIVTHGSGQVCIDDEIFEAKCGSVFHIPKGAKHRLSNTDLCENLVLTEVQIGDYFGEDDIIRYDDMYGRI